MKLGAAHRGDRGRTLGRVDPIWVPGYRLLGRLDGAGEVWRAEGPGGFPTALRVIHPAPGVTVVELQEALSRVGTRHPNVQAAFGSWRVGAALVLAVELPDATLWDRFREAVAAGATGLPRDELIAALAQAAAALDYLHDPAAGPALVHGDVAPRTILRVGGGVKVADVDPARRLDPAAEARPPLYPLYAAPERLTGNGGPAADQYSLALTYVHLRTGRLTADLGPCSLPAPEQAVLARALCDDPEARWPSCRAFVDALQAAATTEPGRDHHGAGAGPSTTDAAPPALALLGHSAALALMAASSVVTLAGTLLIQGATARRADPGTPGQFSADLAPIDRRFPLLADGSTPAPPIRLRLQDPGGPGPATGDPAPDAPARRP